MTVKIKDLGIGDTFTHHGLEPTWEILSFNDDRTKVTCVAFGDTQKFEKETHHKVEKGEYKIISKDEVIQHIEDIEDYLVMKKEILATPHQIVAIDGHLRWREDKRFSSEHTDLNTIVMNFLERGVTKNDEEWRDTYRKIGYSLSGYWEVFYWNANNEDAETYDYPTSLNKES